MGKINTDILTSWDDHLTEKYGAPGTATLMHIIREGLGGQIRLSLDL